MYSLLIDKKQIFALKLIPRIKVCLFFISTINHFLEHLPNVIGFFPNKLTVTGKRRILVFPFLTFLSRQKTESNLHENNDQILPIFR